MRRSILALVAVIAAVAVPSVASAAPPCDPMQTTPVFAGEVPTSQEVLGFELGSREVTAAETNTYVDAVALSRDWGVPDVFQTKVKAGSFLVDGVPLAATP